MGINGWSFPSVAARRNAYTDRLIIRPARGIFQSFFPNSGFPESCTNLRRKFSLPGKCPGSPIAERTDPSEEILYLHHFGTALRGGKGSCRADLSTGRLRHSCHSALPSRTWWNVFLIGNAKISGHPPLPRSYIFPLFFIFFSYSSMISSTNPSNQQPRQYCFLSSSVISGGLHISWHT